MAARRRGMTPEAEAVLAKLRSLRDRRQELLDEAKPLIDAADDLRSERDGLIKHMIGLFPIRDAPTGAIAEAAGVSPGRVYQIRDRGEGDERS